MHSPHRIFVQIPSYRDPQLVATLIDLARQASCPTDVRVVVCWQHDCDETIARFTENGFNVAGTALVEGRHVHFLQFEGIEIELIDVPYLETRGAGWARSVAQERYRGELYNLQIDAHHRFVQGWDIQMVELLESVRDRSPRPLLTGYPPAFCPASYPRRRQENASVMLVDGFTAMGVVRFKAVMLPGNSQFVSPLKARFMSGGFVFSDGKFVEEVRQDPNHFFFTEEIVMAARAYTRGYDFFHPHVPLLWHDYKSPAPEVWEDLTEELKKSGDICASADDLAHASSERARRLLEDVLSEGPPTGERYGLGVERSLRQYERFAGLSFLIRGVHPSATVLSEPDDSYEHLSDIDWERDLICRRVLQIKVTLDAPVKIAVDSVDVVMRCKAGQESVVRHLSQLELSALTEGLMVEFVHVFAVPHGGLPAALLLRAQTSHVDAGEYFSISAIERPSDWKMPCSG